MSINNLIEELKENNQDFEFYPTTKEMIKTIYDHADGGEWLDIGCGTCNFKKYFDEFSQEAQQLYNAKEELYRQSGWKRELEPKEHERAKYIRKYYVIEKSRILLDRLEKDVICLGTDFNSTMLIDKPVNNIFCNPPYSEFEEWTTRIISEANCRTIFLIIPERWQNSEKIKQALEISKSTARVIGSYDFLHAERQARAKVDIIKITRNDRHRYGDLEDYNKTAFDQWFDETFKMRDKADYTEWTINENKNKKVREQLVNADKSKAAILVELYQNEINTLYEHFKAIAGLDVDVLETIGVKKEAVKEALKKQATGTKTRYWKLAIDELEEITDRLTSETRNELFNKFAMVQKVDFTIENIYPFLLWVLKNANGYYNDQLISFFKKLSDPSNVKPYKSNQRVFERDEWRATRFKDKDKISHYVLDYRIIMSSPFRSNWDGRLDDYQRDAKITLQNIFVIARNLGFNIGLCDMPRYFGEECTVLYEKSDKVFMKYRAYKNGNMHVKFDIEFVKAMNVEVSRLLGWIRSAEDIKKEFPTELAKGADKYFKQNYTCLNVGNLALLTTSKKPKIEHSTNKEQLQITINQDYKQCLNIILNQIDNFNAIIEDNKELVENCLKILETEKGFIYRNCLITKSENKTVVEFREMDDYNKFETLLQEVA